MKVYYNPKLKDRAKELRHNTTYGERLLWKFLKGRQMHGYQFMRQKPIENYIVDFCCSKLHLVIEIDGITHDGREKYDQERENKLKSLGLDVIRFDGNDVINNTQDLLQMISDKISILEQKQPPNPFFKGE